MAIDATSWTAIENGAYFRQLGTMITGFAGGRTDPAEVVTFFEGMKNGLDEIVSELTDNYSKNFAKNFFLFSKKDDYETLKRRTDSAKDGFNTLYLLLGKTNVDKIVPPIKVDVGYEGVRKKEEELEKLIEDRDVLNADLKAKKKELSDKRSVLNKTFKPAEKKKLKDEVASLSEEIADIEKKIKDSEKEIKDMEKDVGDMRKAMKQAAREQNAARASAVDPAVNARLQYSNLVKCIEVGLAKLKDLQKQLGTVKMKDDTKGKAFDTGAVVDKSVLKVFGLRGDSPVTLEMLKAKLQEAKDRIATLKDEVESGLESVIRSLDLFWDNYRVNLYDATWTNWEKKCRDYIRSLIDLSNKISRLIKKPPTGGVPDPELMFCNGSKFIKQVEEPGEHFKSNIRWYKNKVKSMFKFAEPLETLYVFDNNMGINHENVKNGEVTKQLKRDSGYGHRVRVSKLPNCLEIACGLSKLKSQYNHLLSEKPFIVIDKDGNRVGDGDKNDPHVKNGKWLCINREIRNEEKGLREVEKVLQASLKAGEWVKLADIK